MGKTLYLECYSGISGDMTVGALLDLGAREEALREALEALPLKGYEIRIGRTKKCGIDACDFDVILEEEDEHLQGEPVYSHEHSHGEHSYADHFHEEHDHTHAQEFHEHAHEGGTHFHNHSHTHGPEAHACHHDHDHDHTHGPEAHAHHHDHVHRHYADIMHMLDEAPLKPEVRTLAKKIFRIVGEAESQVHATPLEEVHFHETGAVDSIVDIVGAAACAVDLGITETYLSTIYEGQGHVWCQHGRIPVPAPAVAGIAAAEELDLAITNASGEMVTPTGAAIAAALRTKKGRPQSFVIRRIGMGAGKKDFPHANLLRAMIIEPAMNAQPAGKAVEETTGSVNTDGDAQKSGSSASEKASSDETEDEIWVLETNLDDCTGEMMGLTMELLLAAGARDVNYTPIYMKKNRPAYQLDVICDDTTRETLENIIFAETTTIGIRRCRMERTVMKREFATIATEYGDATVKICRHGEIEKIYPEYESAAVIAEKSGMPVGEAGAWIVQKYKEGNKKA